MQASERMVAVRISYKKLWMLLLERDIKKASLRHEVGPVSYTHLDVYKRQVQSQSCVETAQKKNFMQFVPLYTLSRWRVFYPV